MYDYIHIMNCNNEKQEAAGKKMINQQSSPKGVMQDCKWIHQTPNQGIAYYVVNIIMKCLLYKLDIHMYFVMHEICSGLWGMERQINALLDPDSTYPIDEWWLPSGATVHNIYGKCQSWSVFCLKTHQFYNCTNIAWDPIALHHHPMTSKSRMAGMKPEASSSASIRNLTN